MVYPAMQVAEILSEHGLNATVVNARFAKPLDTELILPLAQRTRASPWKKAVSWAAQGLTADVVASKGLAFVSDHAEPDQGNSLV